MAQRRAEDVRGQRAQMDDYVRSVASSGGAAGEIDKANSCSTAARSTRRSSRPSRRRRWPSKTMATATPTLSQDALVDLLSLVKDADSVELKLTIPEPSQRSP